MDTNWPETLLEWNTTVKVPISIQRLAEIFAHMDDDKQAKFFVAAAEIMKTWGQFKFESQAQYIGGHLRNCKCSTEEARDLIRNIAIGLEHSTDGS